MKKNKLAFGRRDGTHANALRSFPAQHLATMLLTSFMASACTTTTTPASATAPQPNRPAPSAMNPSYGQALRVIVKFRREVPYRDVAFLQDMARQAHARIAYISSVSADTHVYQVEPQLGQNQADVLRSLSSIPSVLHVEADAVARPS